MNIEQTLSDFMAQQYSDAKLAELLAWAEDGGLEFESCCCFIGLVTADHKFMRSEDLEGMKDFPPHYHEALKLPGAEQAEDAFDCLGDTDEERRAKLIPLIHAEIARRDELKLIRPTYETVSSLS